MHKQTTEFDSPAQGVDAPRRKRSITTLPLMFTSVSAILGSGWLFAVYFTATYAGPASLLSWLIGGLAVMVVAFIYAELSAMIPIMGSSVRIPQYTHGTISGFLFSWLIWLSYASLAPVEVQGVIQYLSYYIPSLVRAPSGGLTHIGYLFAAALMILASAINLYSIKWLLRCNTILTLIKIFVPLYVAITILWYYFSPQQLIHPNNMEFMPFGMHGIFIAMSQGGIVFAFNGFRQACEMAGEAKRPHRTVPIAVCGSVLVCLVLYLLLQMAFNCSLNQSNLLNGWSHLQLSHAVSPLVSIVQQDRLLWLLPFIYIGAILSPFAAGLMYVGSSGRSLYGMSKNHYLPFFFQKVTQKGIPFYAIIVNFFFGMLLFAPLPGWEAMAAFLTSIMAVTYSIAPISLLSLRYQIPHQPRPIKLPFVRVWSLLAFYFSTLLTYWSGWNIVSKLSIALAFGFLLFFIYHFGTRRGREVKLHVKASTWVWPYFIGIALISYLGEPGHGLNIIPFGWDLLVIALFCIVIMYLAMRFTLPKEDTKKYIEELELDHLQGKS